MLIDGLHDVRSFPSSHFLRCLFSDLRKDPCAEVVAKVVDGEVVHAKFLLNFSHSVADLVMVAIIHASLFADHACHFHGDDDVTGGIRGLGGLDYHVPVLVLNHCLGDVNGSVFFHVIGSECQYFRASHSPTGEDERNVEVCFAEVFQNLSKVEVRTAHSLNPVPFIIYDKDERHEMKEGKFGLANVAPTIAGLMGLKPFDSWEESMLK